MSSAQTMEEELQQSVLLSDELDPKTKQRNEAITIHTTTRLRGDSRGRNTRDEDDPEDVDMGSDRDASGEEFEEDASGEEDYDVVPRVARVAEDNNSDEDRGDDEDASGEDDDEPVTRVKLLPGDAEEDVDESEVSTIASPADEDESEDEENWEDARDTAEEDEEESDIGQTNVCMFCKQDEEHDPSEDFEAFLTCRKCGENAHQQCAREYAAMSEQNHPKGWRCPECYTDDSDAEPGEGESDEETLGLHQLGPNQASQEPFTALAESDDEHSQTELNGDLTNGHTAGASRLRRKRQSPSVEADDNPISLRKRRRNSSFASNADELADNPIPGESAASRVRALRLKVSRPPPVSVERQTRGSLVVKIQVRPGNLKEILSRRKRDGRRVGANINHNTPRPSRTPIPPTQTNIPPTPAPAPAPAPTPAIIDTPFTADSYSQPFYSFFDRDTDDTKGKPYGGILTDAEADTSKTLPMSDDRRRFDQAKQKAEDQWRLRVLAAQAETEVPMRKPKKTSENASQIECIEFGGWEIDTWYAAPYPAEYSRNRVLYICEFCLKYMNSDYVAWRHKLKCSTKHPPGDEIYRHGSISMFEVDGQKNPVYCQNLCLLAKLFLGSKTLYYDVEPFLFYVLCEYDECGYHFVGYFSKEKRPSSQNNVSCILTLPIHQRKGYGNLLIDFSYLLTRVEKKTGSPEKPLSDMGLVSYRNYWRLILCQYFLKTMGKEEYQSSGLSIKQISDGTGMTADDVISALEGLRALVKDPQTKLYAFRIDLDYCREYVAKWEAKGHVKLKTEALAWTPYVMGRGVAATFDLGPLSTMAPREDEEAQIQEGPNTVGAETNPILNGVENLMEKSTVQMDTNSGEDSQASTEGKPTLEGIHDGDKENDYPISNGVDSETMDKTLWDAPYENIPATRFEIFPPVSKRADRSRQSFQQPSLSRTTTATSSAHRPRPRRSGGSSSRRSTISKPKPSSSKRKTGGTGRGPGRWPKGTKKADYGNADSGPGFPPGWREEAEGGVTPSIEQVAGPSINARPSFEAQEEVQVFVPNAGTNGGTGEVVLASKPADREVDDEDVDAEGEDE